MIVIAQYITVHTVECMQRAARAEQQDLSRTTNLVYHSMHCKQTIKDTSG